MMASALVSCGGKSGEAVFKLKKLPDIGKYESSSVKKYFHGGPVAEFIPSDSYGYIVPFISEIREFAPENEKSGAETQNEASYGFATLDGRIIVGGIYRSVRTLTSKSGQIVYIAQTFIRTAEDIAELDEESAIGETFLIGQDGSWSIKVHSFPDYDPNPKDYIEVFNADGSQTLYDFNGNVIFDGAKALPGERIESIYYAKNGKFILEVTNDSDKSRVICVNSEGELLTEIKIRDYSVLRIINGVFIVFSTDDSERYNLCDLNGNLLLKDSFDFLSYDESSKSFLCADNDKTTFYRYDVNGKLINKIKTDFKSSQIRYVLSGKDGSSLVFLNDDGKYVLYSTLTGKKIKLDQKNLKKESKNGEPSFLPLYTHLNGEDEDFILLARKDGTQDIYDAFGTYIMSMNDFYGPLGKTPDGGYYYRSKDNKFVVRSHSPRNDFELDLNDRKTAEFSLYSYDSRYVAFLCSDDKGENEFFRVYDLGTKEIAFDSLKAFESYSVGGKTFYSVVTDDEAKLLASDGSELIKLNSDEIF